MSSKLSKSDLRIGLGWSGAGVGVGGLGCLFIVEMWAMQGAGGVS